MQRAGHREELVWGALFGSLAVILVWSRLVGLDQSFWNDEVVTVLRYAGEGPRAIFFGDYAPNNDVLFSLLSWTASELFGDSETTYRIWSVVPALAATFWLVWWAYRRFGHLVAATLLLLMTASPLLFVLSREARGYGLAMLAAVGLVTRAERALADPWLSLVVLGLRSSWTTDSARFRSPISPRLHPPLVAPGDSQESHRGDRPIRAGFPHLVQPHAR